MYIFSLGNRKERRNPLEFGDNQRGALRSTILLFEFEALL